MPWQSTFPPLDIPKCNVLSYLFPPTRPLPTKPIWIDADNPSHSLSSAQMVAWVKRLAVGLDRLGVQKEQAVMVFTPNHIFVPVVYLAAAGSGRCFTGANPTYTTSEVAYQMKNIDAKVVFIHPDLLATGLKAAKEVGIPKNRLFLFSDTEREMVDGVADWRTMLASESEASSWHWDSLEGDVSMSTVAAINFSSGTTGLPKGVCITHRNLVSNAMQAIFSKFHGTPNTPETPSDERWLTFLPLYHAYSQLWTINIAAKLQIPVFIMKSFVFDDYLRYIEKYKINAIQLVPPVMVMLSKRSETKNYDISSLKHIFCGAAPLSKELQNDVSNRFDLVVSQGYGMTETTCAAIMATGMVNDDTGNIGYLLPNTEAKLLDDDGVEVTAELSPGELWVRGPQMLLAYWANEAATRDSITPDGWFKTGDVAQIQDSKWWIVDRKKELIKVNGLQVAPAELEAALLQHEDIADAAVVGIALHDEEWPRAYVVLQDHRKGKTTEDEIKGFVAGIVAKHKRLVGGVAFVDAVPKSPSGKIIRKDMKAWAKRDAEAVQKVVKARL